MRIALVSPYSFDIPGGVQSQVRGLAAALSRRRHEVVVIGPGTSLARSMFDSNLELRLVGKSVSIPVNGSRAPIAPFPAVMRATKELLSSGNFDVAHIHEPLVPGPSLAATWSAPDRRVGTFHRSGASSLYCALRPLARRAVGRLSAATAVSNEARGTIEAVLGGSDHPITVLFNGVDIDRFAPARAGTKDCTTFLFLGRHEKRKGLAVLLEAFTALPGELHLRVGGNGPETEHLKARYGGDKRVTFLGQLSDDDVVRELSTAGGFVAPSITGESFGVVLLDALASGVPLIASDLPGYRQAVGEMARFFPPGDRVALSAALLEVATSGASRAALLSERGLAHARGFSFDELAACYETLYTAGA